MGRAMPTMRVSEAKKLIEQYDAIFVRHFHLLAEYISSKNPSPSLISNIDRLNDWLKYKKPEKKIANWIVLKNAFEKAKELGLKKPFEAYLPSKRFSLALINNNGLSDELVSRIQEKLEEDVRAVVRKKEEDALFLKMIELALIAKERVLIHFDDIFTHPYAKHFPNKVDFLDLMFSCVSQRKDIDDEFRKQLIEYRLKLPTRFFSHHPDHCHWRPLQIVFALELIRNTYTNALTDLEKKSESKQKKLIDLNGLITLAHHKIKKHYVVSDDVKKLASEIDSGRIKKSLSELVSQIQARRLNLNAILPPVVSSKSVRVDRN